MHVIDFVLVGVHVLVDVLVFVLVGVRVFV